MKRLFSLALALCLVVGLCACGSNLMEPVTFYYVRQADHITYGAADGYISPEEREAAGHIGDLSYLLSLYLVGPLDETLVSPFPEGTRLENLVLHQDTVVVVLSEEFSRLSGVELSVACACVSATCFSLTDATEITVISPETEMHDGVSITLTRDSITLIDDALPPEETKKAE